MTADEWEREPSSGQLIEHIKRSSRLSPKARARKCRLAALTMLREFMAGESIPELTALLEAVDEWCEGRGSMAEVDRAIAAVTLAMTNPRPDLHLPAVFPNWHLMHNHLANVDSIVSLRGVASATQSARRPPGPHDFTAPLPAFVAVQCRILRDIFGNPFRPAAFSPAWSTDTAVALARQMYDDREFGAMPILADALQDAGCDSENILSHCRDASQVHVRGCWVVDLVLGKA
jgi:hypothetical protein